MVTDEQLAERMAEGDQVAFEMFVHRYHGPLLSYLDRMLRNPQKAEDFVQETFVRLIRQLRRGPVPEKLKPWIYRVAKNLCFDYWRSAESRSNVLISGTLPDRADPLSSVVDIYERQETRKELLQALDSLSEAQRAIVILRFFQDLKLQDIAEVMDMSLSAVKSSLYQSLKKLKRRYDASSGEPSGKGDAAHATKR
ncbi:RNA polymerase sigma factor [Paenibacillus ginsengihumi]|uniref:RNA polymerase sigma factor n=1 Tax=Paenibacillus ginsengihumi TaxID=431596 RepID=UPI00036CCAF0|nr:RNA polymerase sigma factor [Paenibacillus ginsengihumi]